MSDTQTKVPEITLNDGVEIPQLGFGVFQVPPAETAETVGRAFETGYRHIDTATAYRNEAEVGQAFRASGLERDEVFITTKCANASHGYDEATRALKESLQRLELDFVDLYLIHWPVPAHDRYVDTWRAFIDLQRRSSCARSGSRTSSRASGPDRRRDRRHPVGQPDRAAPAGSSSAAYAGSTPTAASSPRRGARSPRARCSTIRR